MEKIKEVAEKVGEKISEAMEKPAPGHPKPSQYPPQASQKGRVVGIEAEMEPKPNFLQNETEGGFETYKAAGKLIGKKALITGGDSGIGRAVAVCFAMEGADIAIVYLPEEEADAQETKRYVEKYGKKCLCFPLDISVESNCQQAIQNTVNGLGGLDILINNASVMYATESITDITTEQFDRTVKTNVYGTFWMTKYAVPHLKKGASIIQTTSLVAYKGPPQLLDYTMTKSAMLGMTRCLSNQLIEKGIRVNAVAPGPVWTPLQPAAMDEVMLNGWLKKPDAPMGRVGQPIEMVGAYVLLASNDGSYISGQTIHANGGTIVNG
eukprot:TRINITY_DN8101_c0_g1_i1.p1 TRINITY_DN8101_c0_g1~~TRINITY_DN8101_c0_g1_i1.p1  ORF type:complete len:323 (-),score=107.53 TRINITY_DN8101_c0_g1_i1:32-1000(-)